MVQECCGRRVLCFLAPSKFICKIKLICRYHPGGICKVVNIPLHVTHSEWLLAANPQGNQLWVFHSCGKQKRFSWDSEQLSFPGFSIPGSFWINQNHDNWLLKITHCFLQWCAGKYYLNFYFLASTGECMKNALSSTPQRPNLHLEQWGLMSTQLMRKRIGERHLDSADHSLQTLLDGKWGSPLRTCRGNGEF